MTFYENEKLFIVLFKFKRLASLIGKNLIFSSHVDKTKQGTWKHLRMRIAAVIKNVLIKITLFEYKLNMYLMGTKSNSLMALPERMLPTPSQL